jgi:hypothetical protein
MVEKRPVQMVRIDVADYRDLPRGTFTGIDEITEALGLSDRQQVNLKQRLALWIYAKGDPEIKTVDTQLNSPRNYKQVWHLLDEQLREDERPQFIAFLARSFGDRILAQCTALNRRPASKPISEAPYIIPGDSELTDPDRGVAGINGYTSYWMDPDMSPKGLGYTQSHPKRD